MAHILFVDGHNIAFRAYYGVGRLNRRDGFPTGALYGYASTVLRLEEAVHPEFSAAFFDSGRSVERTQLLPDYKAQRRPMPEELRLQLPQVRRLAGLMASAVVERPGVEADDLLASQAVTEAKLGNSVAIASSDKDFAQIVSPAITLWRPPAAGSHSFHWVPMGPDGVREKFAVEPSQIVDYLSLVGDAADNVPGVPQVGPKTAAKWLNSYGSIEEILAHGDELPPNLAKNLREFASNLERNRRLISFDLSLCQTPMERHSFDWPALLEFFREFELFSLIERATKRYGLQQRDLFS
ncbi:MAG: hypothetical protein LBB14_02120 [Puniceicoccales bacterium]|jgi:DNA polymerase-1|nr:hypothetical protein [Puniceicoccales bacterium]